MPATLGMTNEPADGTWNVTATLGVMNQPADGTWNVPATLGVTGWNAGFYNSDDSITGEHIDATGGCWHA